MSRKMIRFNEDVAERILESVATGDITLSDLDKDPTFPSLSTIYRWRRKNPKFNEDYRLALEAGYDMLAERGVSLISDARKNNQHYSHRVVTRACKAIQATLRREMPELYADKELREQLMLIIHSELSTQAVDGRQANADLTAAKFQVDTIKWFLAKRLATTYGDKSMIDVKVDDKRLDSLEEIEAELKQYGKSNPNVIDIFKKRSGEA